MKTTTHIKKTLHVIMITAVIVTSIVITKNMVKNIKYLYGLEPAGKGMSCFYDMIQ